MDGLVLRVEDGAVLTDDVLERVSRGESVQITRGGEVLAEVVAVAAPTSRLSQAELDAIFERVAANREKLRELGVTYSHQDLRDLRDNLGTY